MHLQFKIDDEVKIGGDTYTVKASFDNILKVIDLINDKEVMDLVKPSALLLMLIGDTLEDLNIKEKQEVATEILKGYVEFDDGIQYDLNGNPMPIPDSWRDKHKTIYDFNQDAELIYASFMQAYKIDLIDEQGKLHWFKFKALLSGLPSDTSFKQVLEIRDWTPSKDKRKRNQVMRELQKQVALEEVD